jgi:hypothetical protein
MATITRGPRDNVVHALKSALDTYEGEFPGAEASLYRQNPGSVRIRIIDDRFVKMSRARRHDHVWKFLAARVDEDALSDVSLLLLLARNELASSFMNTQFDDPIPSRL